MSVMHLKRKIEIMINDEADEVVKEFLITWRIDIKILL